MWRRFYDALTEIVDSPNHPGFANVSDPCWTGNFFGSGGKLCSTLLAVQNQYLFWDGLHPTAAAHLLTADLAYAIALTWAMMLTGFAGLSFAGWRARRALAALTP